MLEISPTCSGLVQVLTSCSLASFSLVDSFQSLCGRTLEILPPAFLARLAGLHQAPAGMLCPCVQALLQLIS